jgi:hypothetical protein
LLTQAAVLALVCLAKANAGRVPVLASDVRSALPTGFQRLDGSPFMIVR